MGKMVSQIGQLLPLNIAHDSERIDLILRIFGFDKACILRSLVDLTISIISRRSASDNQMARLMILNLNFVQTWINPKFNDRLKKDLLLVRIHL